MEAVDHTETLPVSRARFEQIKKANEADTVMKKLAETIQYGWPNNKKDVNNEIRAYWDVRDQLTIQDSLIFKGQQLVVPPTLRGELMKAAHASHIGIEACQRRIRDTLYWPQMNSQFKEYMSKCDICLRHSSAQQKEPLLQHEVPARPWTKVAADLCDFDHRQLLVVVDYFSNYIEVERLTSTTSPSVIKALKAMFSRFGIPDSIVSDNGPQFSSDEFAIFCQKLSIKHLTSSPHYPQSNGKAENAVKTVKKLFNKCKSLGQSEYLALPDWRNTPSEGMKTLPAQRLMG